MAKRQTKGAHALDPAAEAVMEAMGKSEDEAAEEQKDDAEQKRANADEDAAKRGKGGDQEDDKPEEDGKGKEEYERAERTGAPERVDEDRLMKAIETLEGLAGTPTIDRRAELAKKLADGTLEKSEAAELRTLLDAEEHSDEPLYRAEPYADVIKGDEQIAAGYDAVPWLERFGSLQTGALDELREGLEKAEDRRGRFEKSLSTVIGQIGRLAVGQSKLIKSLTERLQTVESQPLPRRGIASTSRPLEKAMGAPGGNGEGQIPYGAVEEAMNQMTRESMAQGRQGMSKSGEDIADAWSMFSKAGVLSRGIAKEVKETIGQ